MITLVLFILLIIAFNDNNNLRKEIEELKKLSSVSSSIEPPVEEETTEVKRNYCPRCGEKLTNDTKCDSCGFVFGEKITPIIKPNKKKNPEEQKNNAILITGSILIILSAIIFLTTTWNTSENYLKTLVLVFMFVVFFATSKIADNVFHLKKTSKAFLNIALSYIPILFFSISLFGLFGNYFSINGEGNSIYFSIISFITALIYYQYSSKDDDKYLTYGSYFFQMLFSLFLVKIFTKNVSLLISGLIIYNLIINLLIPKIIKTNDKINNNIGNILYICLSIIICLNFCFSIFTRIIDIPYIILLILYLVDSKIYLNKLDDKGYAYKVLYPMIVLAIVYSISYIIYPDTLFIRNMLMFGLLGINLYQIINTN